MEAVVTRTIERLRPAVEGDGGTLELRSIDVSSGVVRVVLEGSCVGCGTSTGTLLAGISRIVRDHAPEVAEVINVADPSAESETSVSL